jgi:hypothetical protein
MFVLAFENTIEESYVSEKVFMALQAGAIPVYRGAPNVLDFVPENSVVVVTEGMTAEDLATKLHSIAKSPELVASYVQWRQRPPSVRATQVLAQTSETLWHRVCSRYMPIRVESFLQWLYTLPLVLTDQVDVAVQRYDRLKRRLGNRWSFQPHIPGAPVVAV